MLPLASENVLVCLRYGIGDLVMELPALSALRHALPRATITAIATAPAHELLDGDPRIDRVVLTSRWGLRHRWDGADGDTRRAIAAWVHDQRFDLVLDAGHAVTTVSGAIWALGICSLESDEDEERAVIRAGGDGVEAIRAGVRAGWGLHLPPDEPPRLRVRSADRDFADALLRELGAEGTAPFALSPVASHALKRWPVERFAAVADHVLDRGAGPVLVLDGPQPDQGRAVVEAMRQPDGAIRVGTQHLLRTAALLQRCRAFVCNDTGLMHIAAAGGVMTIGVFGPTREQLFLPPGPNTAAAAPAGLDCPHRRTETLYPPRCWRAGHCLIAEYGCIERAPLADVLAAVDEVLDRDPHPGAASRPGARTAGVRPGVGAVVGASRAGAGTSA